MSKELGNHIFPNMLIIAKIIAYYSIMTANIISYEYYFIDSASIITVKCVHISVAV